MNVKQLIIVILFFLCTTTVQSSFAMYKTASATTITKKESNELIVYKSMSWKEKFIFSIVKNKLKKGSSKPDETVKKKWSKLAVFSVLFPLVVTVLVYALFIGFLPAFILLLSNIVIALLSFADIVDNQKKGSFLAILAILISILMMRFFYLQQLD